MRLEEKDLMLLTVGDIMTKKVYTIDADESIRDAADLMSRKGIGCLVVTENEEEDGIAGILTESDILRRVVAVGAISGETRVRVVMSRPLVSASPELSLSDAVLLMFANKIKKLPIVEKEGESGRLVGLVTLTDIAGVQPALIATLKDLYEEKGEAPPRNIKKVMDYYIV
jgi:CBS domain-containing protein